MDPALKHRLIGAAVLSALAIIFLPKLIVGHDTNNSAANVPLTVPGAPGGDFQTKELPLVTPATNVPQGGVVGMDASHPSTPAANASQAVDANGLPLPAGAQAVPPSSTTNAAVAAVTPAAAVSTQSGAAAVPATATPPSTASTTPPIPADSAGGKYVVSLGTYANATNAQALVASLKNSQLPAYAESVTAAGKTQTRVRIGPFTQRGDAEAARLKAQQVRTDMPATVTALDAATPAPDAPANKPSTASTPAASTAKPVASTTAKPAAAAAVPASTDKPATPSPSPAAAGRGYVVQVGAFPSEDKALTLRDKLRAAGFTAFSEKIQAESGTMYRVRVGPEADRDAVDRLRADVSAKLGLNGIVVAFP